MSFQESFIIAMMINTTIVLCTAGIVKAIRDNKPDIYINNIKKESNGSNYSN